MKTIEDLANALGSPGRFQIILCFMLAASYVFVCFGHLGMAFYAAQTDHHCSLPNTTKNIRDMIPTVKKNGKEVLDSCHLYSDVNKTSKIPCNNGWTYNLPDSESTIISEWDLVCDDAYKSNIAAVLYFTGVLSGTLVFGQLSDRFGRKPVFLFTTFSPVIVGLVIYFSNNYFVFIIFRFILGFLLEGLQLTTYTIIVELFSNKYRSSLTLLSASVPWGVGVTILALVSYCFQDWKKIQLFSTACMAIQLPMIWFLPESFRWLIARSRVNDAEAVVARIVKFNKLEFPRNTFEEATEGIAMLNTTRSSDDDDPSKRTYSIIDIFKSRILRKRWGITLFVWISISLSYYGLALNSSTLAGNKYLNFFIGGVLEIAIVAITIFAIVRFGRKKPTCLYSIVGGTTCIIAGVLPDDKESLDSFRTFFSLFGRTCLAGNFAVMFIYTSELFPTVIRNIGLGAGVFGARIGNILAPQILLLGIYTSDSVVFVVFGVMILLAGGFLLMLPETLNKKLPETIEELNNRTAFEKTVTDTAAPLH